MTSNEALGSAPGVRPCQKWSLQSMGFEFQTRIEKE